MCFCGQEDGVGMAGVLIAASGGMSAWVDQESQHYHVSGQCRTDDINTFQIPCHHLKEGNCKRQIPDTYERVVVVLCLLRLWLRS